MSALTIEAAHALLSREAYLLDARRWQDWLALFEEDAVYWVPCWKDDGTPTLDPDTEVSFIYHDQRAALEDRVWRLESGRSAASRPILRTVHAVTNVVLEVPAGAPLLCANWTCHTFDPKHRKQHVFFGRYEVTLRAHASGWRIASKKILLANDYIPTMVDFYCL